MSNLNFELHFYIEKIDSGFFKTTIKTKKDIEFITLLKDIEKKYWNQVLPE